MARRILNMEQDDVRKRDLVRSEYDMDAGRDTKQQLEQLQVRVTSGDLRSAVRQQHIRLWRAYHILGFGVARRRVLLGFPH